MGQHISSCECGLGMDVPESCTIYNSISDCETTEPLTESDVAYSSLMQKCWHGDTGGLESILNTPGADVNEKNDNGLTALMVACWGQGSMETLQVLIRNHANVNETANNGWTALMHACANGQVDCTNALIEAAADVKYETKKGATALMLASLNGHIDCVFALIEAGEINLDHQDSKGNSALMKACYAGHANGVMALLGAGASVDLVDKNGWTALFHACANGNVDCTRILLAAGAKPSHVSHTDSDDGRQWTALMLACVMHDKNVECVQILLEAEVDPDVVSDDGWTSLMYACSKRNYACARALIESKCDVNHQSESFGYTALILACMSHVPAMHGSCGELLIEANAATNSHTLSGENALMIACRTGYIEILPWLVRNVDLNKTNNQGLAARDLCGEQTRRHILFMTRYLQSHNSYVSDSTGFPKAMVSTICDFICPPEIIQALQQLAM